MTKDSPLPLESEPTEVEVPTEVEEPIANVHQYEEEEEENGTLEIEYEESVVPFQNTIPSPLPTPSPLPPPYEEVVEEHAELHNVEGEEEATQEEQPIIEEAKESPGPIVDEIHQEPQEEEVHADPVIQHEEVVENPEPVVNSTNEETVQEEQPEVQKDEEETEQKPPPIEDDEDDDDDEDLDDESGFYAAHNIPISDFDNDSGIGEGTEPEEPEDPVVHAEFKKFQHQPSDDEFDFTAAKEALAPVEEFVRKRGFYNSIPTTDFLQKAQKSIRHFNIIYPRGKRNSTAFSLCSRTAA